MLIYDKMKRIKIPEARILTIVLVIFCLFGADRINGQKLTIAGNQFYLDDKVMPMWGVRVASASQSENFTSQLIATLDDYKRFGVGSISVFIQGSSGGYSNPFSDRGKSIDGDHLKRLMRIIEACQKRSMVVIVGIFYQRTMNDTINCFPDEASVFSAVETVATQLKPYGNVIINIANEQNSSLYRKFKPFNFNDPHNIIRLCQQVKKVDPTRIVGGGGYNDSLNVIIGKSEYVDVLLFDTFSEDVKENHHSGWHYDYFRRMGVPGKPFINVEIFGAWTAQFSPPGVFTDEGKRIHTREIDEAIKRPGLHVHFHSNLWIQGPSAGYPARFDLGGNGTVRDPGIRWWFEHLKQP